MKGSIMNGKTSNKYNIVTCPQKITSLGLNSFICKSLILIICFYSLISKTMASEEKSFDEPSYVSLCLILLKAELNWLENNASEESKDLIVKRLIGALDELKSTVANPENDNLTFNSKGKERIKSEVRILIEGHLSNSKSSLLGFDPSLGNDSSFRDRIKAMGENVDKSYKALHSVY